MLMLFEVSTFQVAIQSLFDIHYFWILAELTELEPIYLINLFNRVPRTAKEWSKARPNFGFFRIFPVFQPKHCTNKYATFLMRIFASNVYECDLTQVPESIVLVSYLLFLAGRSTTLISKSTGSNWLAYPSNCSGTWDPRILQERGQFFKVFVQQITDSQLDTALWFFTTETADNRSQVDFVTTVRIPAEGKANWTEYGSFLFQETGYSGVYANRFYSLHGALLRVGVIVDGLFIVTAEEEPGGKLRNATGLGVEMLDAMAARFNFKYVLSQPLDLQYGILDDDGNWTGLIGDLLNDRIDMAVGVLTMTEQRSTVVDFLGPFMKAYMSTMIAHPQDKIEILEVYKPFQLLVWIITGVAMLLLALVTVVFNRVSPYSRWNRFRTDDAAQEISYLNILWTQIKSMVNQPVQIFPMAYSTRTMILSFWLMVLVWQTSWQATMTAQFSKQEFVLPVRTLKDIAQQTEIRPFFLSGSSVQSFFELAENNEVYQKIYKMASEDNINVTDTHEGVELVYKYRKYAFIHDRYLLQIEMAKRREDFILLNEIIDESPASFAVQKHSPYEEAFMRYLWDLYQKGTIEHWIEKWLPAQDELKTKQAEYRPLNVEAVTGSFIPLICAMTLSLLVLTIELIWHYRRSHTRTAPMTDGHINIWMASPRKIEQCEQ